VNEEEKWLKERIELEKPVDPNEQPFIDSLANEKLSEAELSSCIECLEVLLSLDALPALLKFMKAGNYSMSLRKQAAKAISVIGSSYVETELTTLFASPFPELRLLAEIALDIKSPNARG
jgi:hypothetical protein